ncbi:uncharacterized protein TRIVIDRAFT_220810 [Trichoderma virens Gv29-8]|uniref:Uncharacterized protein n=1 Tax=Hypocrea virens (strain Gv29-8 / FGSC 10586) TaxID=413071 RepID=G9MNU7_HYPVG|nr:uncharacterized protein TRIVIDRAFT_220810 [Trichoderma virens Gv29-8]EHK23550.1 hypothetical protein TRIVIDRAFT_220810 [Trichoderma virens Gv29-8]UKZ49846.1 hypothetical protein TrVGV298_004099 [Trichoderma virens]UKZ76344.1 hypothetical protein TrVFT333_004046 [Trichoderma virens FT-333]
MPRNARYATGSIRYFLDRIYRKLNFLCLVCQQIERHVARIANQTDEERERGIRHEPNHEDLEMGGLGPN